MKKKPIGLHVHSRRADHLVERYIREVGPPVMKWLDDGVNIDLVKQANARGSLTVLRVFEEHQELGGSGEARYLRRIEDALKRWPEFQAIEGYNEAFQRIPDIQRRSDFDIRLMKLCAQFGKKAVIGSFSVGQPQWPETGQPDDWAAYIPALRFAGVNGHYVGLHEYGAPAMQWGVGRNQMSELVEGRWTRHDPATAPGIEGWFVLRYRRSIRHWRALGVNPLPRVLITESGKDDVQPRPNVGSRRGYKTYRNTEWWDHPVYGDFAAQLAWACERWAEDELLVGGVGFGFADVSDKWDDFDLSTDGDTFERLIEEMQRLLGPVDPQPDPDPDPDPDPTPDPEPPSPPDAARYRAYTVQPGDTYWKIAGPRWPMMLKAVDLDPQGQLEPGTVLMIPDEDVVAPPPVPPGPVKLYDLEVRDPTPNRHHSTRREVRWIIVHDPGVTAPVENILSAVYNPALMASYHRLFSDEERPTVYEIVPIGDVAWHAGAFSRIPGTDVRNSDVNTFTWSLSMMFPLPEPSYPALVQVLADMIIEADLPDAGVVLAHHEVSTVPGRRTDPRGIDMNRLRGDIQREVNQLRSG